MQGGGLPPPYIIHGGEKVAKKKKRKLQPHEKTFVNSLIIGLCIAVFFTVLTWTMEITCEEMDVVVHSVNSAGHSRHSRTHLQVITTDGQILRVYDGVLPLVELHKLLTPGTELHVEYGSTWITRLSPLPIRTATKLTMDGQILLDHPPGDRTEGRFLIWLALPFPILGFLCWADGEHLLRKWKKKREKERKRRKKEGITK